MKAVDSDILLLTEHWQSIDQLSSIYMEGYELISCFCRPLHKHGGTAIYSKTHLKIKARANLNTLSMANELECCAAEVLNTNIILVAIYRPPTSEFSLFLDILNVLLDRAASETHHIIIGGDFNINFLTNSPQVNQLNDLLGSYNLHVSIHSPTRFTDTSSTCIDNFMVNIPLNGYTATCIDSNISDHLAITIEFSIALEKCHNVLYKRNLNQFNRNYFLTCLQSESWQEVYSATSSDAGFNALYESFTHYINICFPFYKCSSHIREHWVTEEALSLRDQLFLTKELAVKYPVFKEEYRSLEKYYQSFITQHKKVHNENYILRAKNKNKAMWHLINENTNRTRKSALPDNFPSSISMCDAFNTHFANSAKSLVSFSSKENSVLSYVDDHTPYVQQSIFLTPVTADDVRRFVLSMNSSTPDEHNLSPLLLKLAIQCIAVPLAYIINLSFEQGEYPSKLKSSLIIPLFKKGDQNTISNYRPISIIPYFAKIFDHLMNVKLMNFLLQHKIINSDQHGFISGKCTDTALFHFISEIHKSFESRRLALGLFVDLSCAFDCVDHGYLLNKLERSGIRGVANDWFRSYLAGRTQRVRCLDSLSESLTTNLGLPQGGALSPTLFIIFINDLSSCLRGAGCSLVNYADDINVCVTADALGEVCDRANAIFIEICNWMSRNRLVINSHKTKCILFCKSVLQYSQDRSIVLNGTNVDLCSSAKLLGVMLASNLSWGEHIDFLCSKLGKVCFALRSLKGSCMQHILITFYHSNFISSMRYGIVHWGFSANCTRVFSLQKRALRTIYSLRLRESCRNVFKDNNLLTFYDIYILDVTCFVYKFISEFNKDNVKHKINTRQERYLLPPKHSTAKFQASLIFRGCLLYNKLPVSVRALPNLRLFKAAVKRILLSVSCYSIRDFMDCDLNCF